MDRAKHRGPDRPGRRPASVPGLPSRRRCGRRLQRPAAGLLLWRRSPVAAQSPAEALRRPRGRSPAGGGCPHQERGEPSGALGARRCLLRALAGPSLRPSPPVLTPLATFRCGRRHRGRGVDPTGLLAIRNSRSLPELSAGHVLGRALAGRDGADPWAPAEPLARAGGLGFLLARRVPGAARRLARPAPPRRAGPGVGGRGAARDRLDRLFGQPASRRSGQDELEPFPAPGLGARPGPLCLCPGRSAAPRFLAASGLWRTCQISVSMS